MRAEEKTEIFPGVQAMRLSAGERASRFPLFASTGGMFCIQDCFEGSMEAPGTGAVLGMVSVQCFSSFERGIDLGYIGAKFS
jgi:hypothetical protein